MCSLTSGRVGDRASPISCGRVLVRLEAFGGGEEVETPAYGAVRLARPIARRVFQGKINKFLGRQAKNLALARFWKEGLGL